MAKISNKPITIPQGIAVSQEGQVLTVSNNKGKLTIDILSGIAVTINADSVVVSKLNDEDQTRAFEGLIKSLLKNAFIGLTDGYQKTLKLVGTGYRVAASGQGLTLNVGYSHPVEFQAPPNITLAIEGTNLIKVSGFDKQLVGQAAANIRALRPPEPYKGKGIRYEDEVVRRKAGKTAGK
ncbi:50S ribosomal protein L6 [Microgenomates group bacterium]|nr:50S ribosomal protein L6 [Microgenomates group bacterium]